MNHDSGPAFPVMPPCDMEGASAAGYPYPEAGMSLRDYFAAKVIAGLYVSYGGNPSEPEQMAEDAYAIADAMLQERRK